MRVDLKLLGVGAALAAIGLGFFAAVDDRHASGTSSYPPGCTVAIGGAPGYLPRAAVTIENRTGGPMQAWLAARNGLARVELGMIGESEMRVLAHVLPAGRNLLQAAPERGGPTRRTVLNVANHGAATCKRRYVWRIE